MNAVCQPEQELWLDGDNGLPVGTTFEGYVGVFNEESWSADIELNEDVRLVENTNRYPSDDRWFYGYADYENMRVNGEFVLPEGVYWVNDTPGEVSDYESSGDSRVLEYTNNYSTVGCGNTENPGVPPVITVPSTAAECFEFKDGVITDYYYYNDDCPSDVVVPDAINGEAVVAIGDDAFYDNYLTSVEFKEGLETIGINAFNGSSLTSVEFPSSLKTIGSSSFENNQLTSVEFNDGLEIIDGFAFYNNNLTSVEFPSTLKKINRAAFQLNSLTNVVIPVGVETYSSFDPDVEVDHA